MRPLLVAEQLRRRVPGGIGTYVRGLARETEGVTLWASRPPSGGGRAGPDPLVALGRPVVTSPLPGRALVWAWDRGWGWGPAAPPPGHDVVHAPSLAVPAAVGNTPLAVTVHDLAWRRVPETFPARGRRWHEAALARALSRASILLAPSRQTADDLLAAGAAPERVEVVDEGCDHLPAPDPEAAATLLRNLGVEADYLLSVSTLEPRKNLPRLVAAYQAARDRLPGRLPLVVAGPVGWGDELGRTGPGAGVVLTGNVDGAVLAGLYAAAAAVVTVPLFEGYGLPAVEAMACGAPVVASPQPSLGGAAYEVDPLDVDAIAAALVRVSTDASLRADLVEAGRERAATLTWAAAAARHQELWGSLSAGAPRGVRR
ncbi:MAG: glycosyltransferase family 4 protein [Acidimicrobiia bacterium]